MSGIATSGPDFDLSFLLEIADGSNEFIIESIDMFLVQTPELLQTIEDALGSADLAVVASASHKLKPNLGFFGMTGSQATMQEIETLSKAGGDITVIKTKFDEVNAIITPCLDRLLEIKKDKETQA